MMDAFGCTLLLLADKSHWQRLGDAFSEKNSSLSSSELLLVAGMVGVLAVVVLLLQDVARRQNSERTYCRPRRLFRELCTAHGLRAKDRRLLTRLARQMRLDQPAVLFVKPDLFAREALDDDLAGAAEDIRQLRERLFGFNAEE